MYNKMDKNKALDMVTLISSDGKTCTNYTFNEENHFINELIKEINNIPIEVVFDCHGVLDTIEPNVQIFPEFEKYKNAPFRAPMVIVLINTPKEHPMVPEIEQVMSTAAAGQNILLALSAMGFGGIWRTGSFALNDKIGKFLGLDQGQNVVGYLYVGTPKGDPKRLPEVNVSDFVTKWND